MRFILSNFSSICGLFMPLDLRSLPMLLNELIDGLEGSIGTFPGA